MKERERKKRKIQHIIKFLIIIGVWYTEYAYIDYDRDITARPYCL